MNYYIQGNAAKADKIKAAFEKLGYEKVNVIHIGDYANERLFFFTENGKVRSILKDCGIVHIIKTHPDYKELELPVEPKFKVGSWLYHNSNGVRPVLVTDYDERHGYQIQDGSGRYHLSRNLTENEYHLWSIADAKDGDVLSTNSIICIFKKLDKDGYYIISPCIYTVKGGLEIISDENDTIGSCGFKPATKEDRDLLFAKMLEAGYTWDEKKKKLRKIQPHYDIANFQPFDKVLIRVGNKSKWTCDFFSYYHKGFHCIGTDDWSQCIPYNEETKHLLGTTDPCDEQYINW